MELRIDYTIFYPGAEYSGSRTEYIDQVVIKQKPTEKPPSNDREPPHPPPRDTGRTPGFSVEAILIGFVLSATAILLKKRKK